MVVLTGKSVVDYVCFRKESDETIPIVMSSSDEYADFLLVALMSIKVNSNGNSNYDIVILSDGISESKKERIIQQIISENISVRFVKAASWIEGKTFRTDFHVTKTTYLRLAVIDLMARYKKIIYLDCDVIVNTDIAYLFRIDVEGYLVAAVMDTLMYGWCHMSEDTGYNHMAYLQTVLGITDVRQYFNAGVMLINIEELQKRGLSSEALLCEAASYEWKWFDQDVLNKHLKGKVLYLDNSWNVMVHVYAAGSELAEYQAGPAFYEKYRKAIDNPKIVHYAGNCLPVNQPTVDRCDLFWKYARHTTICNFLQQRLIQHIIDNYVPKRDNVRSSLKNTCIKHLLGETFMDIKKRLRHFIHKLLMINPTYSRIFETNYAIKEIKDDVFRLQTTINKYQARNQTMMWYLLGQINIPKTLTDSQKWFWDQYPKAESEMRVVQTVNLFLVEELSKICQELGINFWLHGGTLIGALRHRGFIPWDDDVDVGMLRKDLDKLTDYLKGSTNYYIQTAFHDNDKFSRGYQFKSIDSDCCCFIDIFPFDYYSGKEDTFIDFFNEHRVQMVEDYKKLDANVELEYVAHEFALCDSLKTPSITKVFEKALDGSNVYQESNYIYYSIENYPFPYALMEVNDIFPLQKSEFESLLLPIPLNSNKYLWGYGDWKQIPSDVENSSHFYYYKPHIEELKRFLNQRGVSIDAGD